MSSIMDTQNTKERKNPDNWHKYGRLCYLLQDEAPYRLRQYLNVHLPEGKTIDTVLTENRSKFDRLKRTGRIPKHSYELLYPLTPGVEVKVDSFDMTLLVCVIRNVSTNAGVIKWDKTPGPDDKLPQHDVIRLKLARNALSHVSLAEFGEEDYRKIWWDVSSALLRLGTNEDVIKSYESRDLDPDATSKVMLKLKEQALDDMIYINKEEAKSRRMNRVTVLGFVAVLLALVISMVTLVVHLTTENVPCRKKAEMIPRDLGMLRLIHRDAWEANPPVHPLTPSKLPFRYVIISHSAYLGGCHSTDDCCDMVKKTQEFNQKDETYSPMDDIAYNYLIGGDNVIYEGRGHKVQGAFAKGWNNVSLGFSFIGEYSFSPPKTEVAHIAQVFFDYLVTEGVLHENYTVYGHCQISKRFPLSPGWALYQIIRKFRHWSEYETNFCTNGSSAFNTVYSS